MTDIDYSNKSDRDLLVEVVTVTNGISQKLDTFCGKVEVLEKEQTVLSTNYDTLVSNGSSISKKTVAVSAGAGGGIVGILLLVAQAIIDYLSK